MDRMTSPAPSARAVELLERMASEEESRERERLRSLPHRLHALLHRRWLEAVAKTPKTRTLVQRTDDGSVVLDADCQAVRVTYSNAGQLDAEANAALQFLHEAEEFAREARRLPLSEIGARCADLAQRAGLNDWNEE